MNLSKKINILISASRFRFPYLCYKNGGGKWQNSKHLFSSLKTAVWANNSRLFIIRIRHKINSIIQTKGRARRRNQKKKKKKWRRDTLFWLHYHHLSAKAFRYSGDGKLGQEWSQSLEQSHVTWHQRPKYNFIDLTLWLWNGFIIEFQNIFKILWYSQYGRQLLHFFFIYS